MGYLTPINRNNPFERMRRLMDEMERSFFSDTYLPATEADNSLTLDVSSDEKNVIVRTPVPGVDEKDIHVAVHGDVLTITAEAKHEQEDQRENYYMREMRYGKFSRSVRLPEGVNTDKADADLENGVLTIKLPKTQTSPVKQIAVKARNLLTGKSED